MQRLLILSIEHCVGKRKRCSIPVMSNFTSQSISTWIISSYIRHSDKPKYYPATSSTNRVDNKGILYEIVPRRQIKWTTSKTKARATLDGGQTLNERCSVPNKLSIEKTQLKLELGNYAVCCSPVRVCVCANPTKLSSLEGARVWVGGPSLPPKGVKSSCDLFTSFGVAHRGWIYSWAFLLPNFIIYLHGLNQ